MVTVIEIIKPVLYGVVVLTTLIFFGYMFIYGLQQMGIIKRKGFTGKGKVSKDVLIDTTRFIMEEKTFIEFAEYISKFEKLKQQEYLTAYYKVIEVKGGENNG